VIIVMAQYNLQVYRSLRKGRTSVRDEDKPRRPSTLRTENSIHAIEIMVREKRRSAVDITEEASICSAE
jgi:hypothetical protein